MTATAEQQEPFVKVPIEVLDLVTADKLTLNAAYLYVLMLTHINYKRGDSDVWPSRSSLARRMGLKNPRAVDRYITELIDAGLVERERRRDGLVNDTNKYTLAVVCWPPVKDEPAGGSALQNTRGGVLGHTGVVRSGTPELDEPQLDELQPDQRAEQSSLTSGRCAPSGEGEVGDESARTGSKAAELAKRRADDRKLFRSLIGAEHLRSDGTMFTAGVFTVDQFYNAFRKRRHPSPVGFPGVFIEPMCREHSGVEDWLLSCGLEPV